MDCNECGILKQCQAKEKCTSCVYIEFKASAVTPHFVCTEKGDMPVTNANVNNTCDEFRCMTFISE